jgi:hypothetical protein
VALLQRLDEVGSWFFANYKAVVFAYVG